MIFEIADMVLDDLTHRNRFTILQESEIPEPAAELVNWWLMRDSIS